VSSRRPSITVRSRRRSKLGLMVHASAEDECVRCLSVGYVAPDVDRNGTSVPRTVLTPGASSDHAIPKEMVANLRNAAGMYFPRLAEKDFVSTRLCWCVLVSGFG
jgi:hypothetical protein